MKNSLLLGLGALLCAGTATLAGEREASADIRVHVGGAVRVGSPHVRVGGWYRGYRPYRPSYRPYFRPFLSGSIWVGSRYPTYVYPYTYYYPAYRYAAPPPPPAPVPQPQLNCECGPGATVPSYYSTAPAPSAGYGYGYQNGVYGGPSASVAASAPSEPPLPGFAIGVFGGGVNVDGERAGSDVGLLARLRLTEGLLLEGELGKSELTESDSDREDRRMGGSLVWEIGARNPWAPYLVAGLGVTQVEVDGDKVNQSFGEVGVGLRFALSEHVHLTADIRGGARRTLENDDSPDGLSARATVTLPDPDETEKYTRARLAALIYF